MKKGIDKIKIWFSKVGVNIKKHFCPYGNQKYNLAEVIVIMIITIVFGFFIGILVSGKKSLTISSNNNVVSQITTIYDKLVNGYYKDVDEDKLIEAAVNGMVEYLDDDYTVYYTAEEKKTFLQQLSGSYEGIGILMARSTDNKTVVVEVYDSSPAATADIHAGDVIISVNDNDIADKTLSEIATLVKSNSKVTMTIERDGTDIAKELTLQTVNLPSVSSKVIEENGHKVGYISLSIFAGNTATQFKEQLLSLEQQNIESLVIDVRGNGGGHLYIVKEILSLFVAQGEPLYQTKSKDKTETTYDETKDQRTYPIAVLTNKGSASASEILAACIKETYKGEIVGTTTYGKGTVQTTIDLPSGGLVKYTIQTWLSPKGNEINDIGVTPTVEVEYEEADNQLDKALEVLTSKSILK